jgi:type I restriction enzyme M protein
MDTLQLPFPPLIHTIISLMTPNNFREKANFIWQVADDILRGAFKAHEYGDVILPFVVLRRLDLVLEPQKDAVIKQYEQFKDSLDEERLTPILRQAAGGINFYNHSFFDLRRLAQDSKNIELNFNNYLNGYSKNVREIIENFQLEKIITKLVKNDLLYQLVEMFTEVDLSPANVTNHEMGYIFEELLRRFSEMSNETAGEHYTPREVIRLMVSLMFAEHKDELKGKGIIRTVFDPACGTGGMLVTAKEYIHDEINPDVEVVMYGQELNEQTYAIAKSDVLIMGENAENIRDKSSFSKDQFKGQRFTYMLSNPPFGVSWVKEENFIRSEANDPHGRFTAGTPRTSDGALLFLQHMISKMEAGGSRIAIIFNGSPLFTGDAGSGESNIRKWIIENDWLEAIVAMPTEMFYNTGIATYIWMVTNRKPAHRKGKVQLINAVDFATPMRKGLGNKRQYFTDEHIRQITKIYTDFAESKVSKIFDNEDFGYTKVTVERPLQEEKDLIDVNQKATTGKNGKKASKQLHLSGLPKPDPSLRDYEKIPLKVDVDAYFEREVKPHVPDAWMERSKDKVGYEISFAKYFYEYQPLRSLTEIKADIQRLEAETDGLLGEILG